MRNEIMLAMPVNQITCLCLTVAYKPNYTDENADLILAVENVAVPAFNIEQFIKESNENYFFGLEESAFTNYLEFREECPTLAEYLQAYSAGTCAHIISAFYIDELGKCQMVAEGLEVDKNIQWEIAKGWGR